ncbi:putative secreted protein (Por secretion system target) [Gelidibacter algens]|uniref:Putative secreted protein (Por secretion system target) n=1 Tax=Gelidibacter algens TaxID=49280 RepID=A0A1A7QTF1_9FLAO|nr:endonuclease [Gelidibacter algens]OBX23300.1 endonuclease I [Gelidibacter algens]RAJ18680.1 putative secreted protein (Por secretion system target) [Gelidibacter algens]
MKYLATFFVFMGFSGIVLGQVVINELDSDTPSTDTKEFVELLSETPNYPLDGYVLVFFNGSATGGNQSYLALNLDGYETDINGVLLIGSNSVTPTPQYVIPVSVIQNGPDAIALYRANDLDFPEFTLAYVDDTLIDVMVYGTNDAEATGLLDIFRAFDQNLQQLNEGSNNNTNSIQRFVDDGVVNYRSATPTPRQLNDGSGVVLNGVLISIAEKQYHEGDTFTISFTTEQNVADGLSFTLSLSNYGFNADDYIGETVLTIPIGANTVSTTITVIDDSNDEGDEVIKVRVSGLPPTFVVLNNNLQIRIIDNDFTQADFGTPINPTFGRVNSTQPDGYYNSLHGMADTALRQAIQDIIAKEGVVRAQAYAEVIEMLKEADQNPEHSNEVWLVYIEKGRPKLDYQYGSENFGTWNREHTYPRSRGRFYGIDLDEIFDGKEMFWNTNADSLRHGYSDAHALRAVDSRENSRRNNLHYGQYNGPKGTLGKFKGDVARSVFYMAARYKGLEIVNGFPEGTVGELGDLSILLKWHREDPPDDFEMNRNNIIYTWQINRNPFIDQPELIEFIWGNKVGQVWDQELSTIDADAVNIKIHPNPTKDRLYITGIKSDTKMEVFTMDGRNLLLQQLNGDRDFYLSSDYGLSKGIYVLRLNCRGKSMIKKVVVE